jgi:6,7-dimethyl-8-ribityllumazine synthase
MASADKNASLFDLKDLPSAHGMKFGIVVAEWNSEITDKLHEGAIEILSKTGASHLTLRVPGTFELVSGARLMAIQEKLDGVICLGCVIQGETRHFEFICNAVANGLIHLNASTPLPFIFGVLTTENLKQANERCGGAHGHKGKEAAVTAIKMATLKKELKAKGKIGF